MVSSVMNERPRTIAIIGLGYVGLPLAIAFCKAGFSVVGFDTSHARVDELHRHLDRTREIDGTTLESSGLQVTDDIDGIRAANFFIVTVPTPIDDTLSPDISMVLAASRTIGGILKPGDIVVYESTVYPGATEEDCVPVLETASGLRAGIDFGVGYSPERINPGDRAHTFDKITKVVSALDVPTRDVIATTYGAAIKAGIYLAPSIMVAEAAKVIENTQRDLNIALMNELALIFARLQIDTGEVLAAAGTKWNFLPFTPGLVGGHCIGVDPYYLTHRARRAGYHAEVVLAGRRVNDEMGRYVAREAVRHIVKAGSRDPVVTVLGITFKEDVPDIRNTRVVDIITELRSFGMRVQLHDPQAYPEEVEHEYGLALQAYASLEPADGVILAVGHRQFAEGGWDFVLPLLRERNGFVLDVKRVLDKSGVPDGVTLWRL